MKEKLIKVLPKYLISFIIGGIFVYVLADLRGYSPELKNVDRYLILCDAFTIPGIAFLMIGFLVLLSSIGATDGISYLLAGLVKRLLPIGRWRDERYEKYDLYIARKRENRPKGFLFLFVVGGVFMAAAAVYMILFYRLY